MRIAVALLAVPLLSASAQSQETIEYTYDALGRLIEADHGTGGDVTYDYDEADNRTSVTVNGGSAEIVVVPLNGFTVIPLE